MQKQIHEAIAKALADLGLDEVSFVVERPGDLSHGDYATNAALKASGPLTHGNHSDISEKNSSWTVYRPNLEQFRNPVNLGNHLKEVLENKIEGVEKITIAGPGFINFHLSREAVVAEAQKAVADSAWGGNELYAGKGVMVEYTDPNPFKEFHIGHLMSNAIGEAIARTLEAAGAKVARANYQGDVGLHVAKAIWGKQQNPDSSWGEAYVYGSEHYDAHKEEVDTLNKTIYDKTDDTVNSLYAEGREKSLEHFEAIYKTLGTKFDYYFFESETGPLGLTLVHKHPDVFEASEGALVFKGEQYGLHTRVFVNSKGLPTYEAKELGLVEAKKAKGNFDVSLTVTANEISEYFKVVRCAAEKVFPDLEGKMLARFHGFLKLTTGKMSSRKGNVITGESLLNDLQNAAKEKMQGRELKDADKVAEQVAVAAIKYTVLKQGSGKDIVFDPEKSLSFEGDSGPYLQYARVRALSLIAKAEAAGVGAFTPGMSAPANELDRLLLHFADVVERAVQDLEPHHVTTYLTELASAFNTWYANTRLIGGEYPEYALLLTRAFERTMSRGLHILGIPAPEEM